MKVIKTKNALFINIDEDDPIIQTIEEASEGLLGAEIGSAMVKLWSVVPEGYLLTSFMGGLVNVVRLPDYIKEVESEQSPLQFLHTSGYQEKEPGEGS